ncbi:MAG: hypothetical protein OQK09_03845 [Colwellia sp.]|nr:hypothetical protein [Colwellia sp.]MCW8866476.1 hypothetical protein [Colwellia sp.]MCW9080620.1 hypothetical protein [Colwellia sp.]
MKNAITIMTTLIGLSLLTTPLLPTMAKNSGEYVKKSVNNDAYNKPKALPKHRDGKPPQQAIEICLTKGENSLCSFQGSNTLEQGACEFTPDKQYFACNPNNHNKQPRKNMAEKRVEQLPSHLVEKHN